MAKAPQLAAVALALVLVVGAAGYGVVRGLTSDTNNSVPPPSGFRVIVPQRGDVSWFIAVPGSPVPKGTLPNIWISGGEPALRKTGERSTVVVRVDGPDGHTVSSINSNFVSGTSQLIRMVDEPLTASGKYGVAVSLLSKSRDVGAVRIAEGDFTVSD